MKGDDEAEIEWRFHTKVRGGGGCRGQGKVSV